MRRVGRYQAQSRLESCCVGKSRVSNALAVERFANASIKGIPPVFWVAGRLISWASTVAARRATGREAQAAFYLSTGVHSLAGITGEPRQSVKRLDPRAQQPVVIIKSVENGFIVILPFLDRHLIQDAS